MIRPRFLADEGIHGEDENNAKEKEADISTSLSGCSYTPRLVN